MDEGVDVDARAGAPCVKHHGVENAAVVGRPAQAGQNPTHQTQQRVVHLGPAGSDQQGQEAQEAQDECTQPGGQHHGRSSGGSASTK